MQLVAVALDQEWDVARHQPRQAVADEKTEIMPLDMRDQHLGARLGKSRGQVDHETTFSLRQLRCCSTTVANKAAPVAKRMMPEDLLIQPRWRGSIARRNNPMPRLTPNHHTNDPTHTPSTRNPARTSVACAPPRARAAKIARKTRIVTGLVMVSAKAEAKSRSRVSGFDCSVILSRTSVVRAEPPI